MIIYFLRHASAGKKTANTKKDERRPLDQEGILQARYVGRLLASIDVQVEHVLSSPLKRSLQTATLVANELAHETAIRMEDALRPESDYAKFREMLSRYRKYEAVMVVGHNPNESEFLSKTVSSASGTAHIELKKGSVAKVDLDGRNGVLEWLITPKIARTIQATLKPSSRPKTSRK
ncbi:MAG TPA: phosphohistidine phosphatase SixA [Candidatus Angelobacter sp.]|nr:phosphohistidine phosphatase SixA [Candidatus Angelobacter sp.]